MCYKSESKLQFLQQRMMKNFHLILLLIHVNTRLYDELVEFHCGRGFMENLPNSQGSQGLETRKHQDGIGVMEELHEILLHLPKT